MITIATDKYNASVSRRLRLGFARITVSAGRLRMPWTARHKEGAIACHVLAPWEVGESEYRAMGVWEELHAVAARLSSREDRPTCQWCGRGKLQVIMEAPDSNFGALGVTQLTLKCDDPGCGKLTVI